MPGTIHISVPDFKDLPSSISPSSILTKVTMGKREHQSWDKGDFSFPLTKLRDNVTITIQDTEGNQISQTVVQTMLVVERGSWDEFISLGGGGKVHMKLQFVLSEEERNRIRSMRESAMKKKFGYSETASTTGDTVTSSLGINHEVSDSRRSVTHNEALSIGKSLVCAGDEEERKSETALDQRQIKPNDTDGSGETSSSASMSKSLDTYLGDVNPNKSLRKITELPLVDLPNRPELFQDPSSTKKKNLVAFELKVVRADQPEKHDPFGKTPSNVRKMISAFESSLDKDMRPGIKPPPAVKLQYEDPKLEGIAKPVKPTSEELKKPSLFGESQRIQTYEAKGEEHIVFGKGFNEDQNSKVKTKPVKPVLERLNNPLVIEESQQVQTYEAKKEEYIAFDQDSNGSKSSQKDRQLEVPSSTRIQVKEIESIPKPRGGLVRFGEVKLVQNYKAKREAHIDFDKDLNRRKSSPDAGQLKDPSITQIQVKETEPENELIKRQEDLEGATAVERHGNGVCSSYCHAINIQEVLEDKLESAAFFENEHFSCECYGAWIFPDHARRLCITTGSKQVMDLVEGCEIQEKNHKVNMSSSLPENSEKPDMEFGNDAEVKKGDETSHVLRSNQLDSSAEVENSNGPIGQAVKVAIMVAFGVLVLLTRQRNHR